LLAIVLTIRRRSKTFLQAPFGDFDAAREDAKSYQIVEGSGNIQKAIIGQDAMRYRKANR
jgi:hypothetical protein